MKGPAFVVLTSLLLLGTALSGEAEAQKKKVVVEMFKGPNAPRARITVMRALARSGMEIVPDKKLAAVEADLGLIRVSDSYTAIARETRASAFVAGFVTGGRRPKARVVVRNAEGKIIGAQGWQATNAKRLLAAINATAGPRLAGIINTRAGGGAAAGAAVASRAAAEDPLPPAPRRREEPAEEPAAAKETAEEPAGEETAAAEREEGADAEVEAEADEPARKTAKAPGTGLTVAFVLRTFSRNFEVKDQIRGITGYRAPEEKFANLPLVPAPGLALEYFPVSFLGGFASFNYGIAGSKDSAAENSSTYKTTVYSWMVGAKGRLPVSSLLVEPSIGYGTHVFKIHDFDDSPNGVEVAPVDYKHIRLGGGVGIPFAGGTLSAGGHYLHILDAGAILDEEEYFKGNAIGGEVFAGVTLPLSFMKGLDFRAGLDYRRIAFAFTPEGPEAERVAGGAVDQYIGLNLGVGYNLGM